MTFKKFFISIQICCAIFSWNASFGQSNRVDYLAKAIKIKNVKLDSAFYYLNKEYQLNIQKKDTIGIINCLIEQSDLYAHSVNYGKSYDGYWEALLLADKLNDSVSIAKIYRGLGWLYSYYKRDKEALKYFNLSIEINKRLIKSQREDESSNVNNYYSIVNLYRANKDFEKAQIYIDSCRIVNTVSGKKSEGSYVMVESAYLDAVNGNFSDALDKMNSTIAYFQKNNQPFLIINYALLGDVYAKMNRLDESLSSYKKSLVLLDTYKMHLNYRPIVYESLSELYFKKNNIVEAYKYLKKAKEENDLIFGGKSEFNQHLLEIKDKYRLVKDNEQQLLNKQRIEQLEYEDKVSVLKSTILIAGFVFTILFGYLFFRHLRNKHKNEKIILQEKQKLQLQEEQLKLERQAEVLEIRNKELTESALRLIEKDEFIDNVEKMIADKMEVFDVNKLKHSLKNVRINSNSNWEEFEARFIAVNQSFYDKLNNDFPQLTQTDQKICALVKLNLPSKHMSKLLGISVESVHSSRYRLRKKLGLSRTENLEEFINTL